MMTTEQPVKRKAPVRWTDAEIELIWRALPEIIRKHRSRGLTWQVQQAAQDVLEPERWRKMAALPLIPRVLLARIANTYPETAANYPQLGDLLRNSQEADYNDFLALVAETRMLRPVDDFVDIWNECVQAVPELKLQEASHIKYVDKHLLERIQQRCVAYLTPDPEFEVEEAPPAKPDLDTAAAADLLLAYHLAMMREIKAMVDKAPEPTYSGTLSNIVIPALTDGPGSAIEVPRNGSAQYPHRVVPPVEEPGREKIRITICDHNVSRNPDELEREYANHPRFRFKFEWACLASCKGMPSFKQNGYAIICGTASQAWKIEARRICGADHVLVPSGSRESVLNAMTDLVRQLEKK